MIRILGVDYNEGSYVDAVVKNMEVLRGVKVTLFDPLDIPRLVIELNSENNIPDYFESGPLPIISESLRQLFLGYDVEAEYFPVELQSNKIQLELSQYYFMHILEQVDCIDANASIFELDDGYFDNISKLVLKPEKTTGKHLFRAAKTYDLIKCVSEEMADKLSSYSGLRLISPAEWHSLN